MRAMLLVLLLLLLSGCGAGGYAKPGVTQEEFERDLAQCEYEAELATAGIRSGLEQGQVFNRLVVKCMFARGYTAAR